MNQVVRRSLFASAMLVVPSLGMAQGLAIEHKAVQCIVAGKYPKMNACFNPASSLSRSRVFFRAEGTPKWYYVEMKSDAPCFSGILPKPKKALVSKKIEYYVEAVDKAFAEGQTETYLPVVVASESECEKKLIAPIVPKASVTVFPSMPAGFAGGTALSATTVALGVVGAGAATAGVVAASNSGSNATTTTVVGATTPTTAAPVTTVPPTTAPPGTTLPPSGTNKPPNAVFRVNPNPPNGTSPLTVTFNMCGTTDPENDPLQFSFFYGDGKSDFGGACRRDNVYTATSLRGVTANQVYKARTCVSDGVEAEGHEQCHTFSVDVGPPVAPNPCRGDTTPPFVQIAGPPSASPNFQSYPINFTANASDPAGILSVTYKAKPFYQGSVVTIGSSSTAPYTVGIKDTNEAFNLFGCNSYGDVFAEALDTCKNLGVSATVTYKFDSCAGGAPPAGATSSGRLAWTSELDAPGAQGQVVLNGSASFFPRTGRSMGLGEGRQGENRLEAVLVEGQGRPGTWRFEFAAGSIEAGSLRVVAGDVVLVTDTVVVFRVRGQSGERVVFTLHARK